MRERRGRAGLVRAGKGTDIEEQVGDDGERGEGLPWICAWHASQTRAGRTGEVGDAYVDIGVPRGG